MPEPILKILTFCLVALLYLFFFRVLRAVWAELKTSDATTQPASSSAGPAPVPQPVAPKPNRRSEPVELRVLVPPSLAGQRFPIAGEMTVGRAAGCAVHINDPTVSSLHARVARSASGTIAEDLGSRNGTWINGRRLTGQTSISRGDRLRFGNVELEVA